MNLNHMLCFQIAKTHQLFNRFYKRPLSRFHLTYVQYIVLIALWGKDGVTVNQLSARVSLNNGTLTPLLKRLQRAGWIDRKRDHHDERRVIITLTPQGHKKQRDILNSTQSCMTTLNYSAANYRKTIAEVKDIQRRLRKSMRSYSK